MSLHVGDSDYFFLPGTLTMMILFYIIQISKSCLIYLHSSISGISAILNYYWHLSKSGCILFKKIHLWTSVAY